jgi:transcriptional regulator with XRE-family HTH domain
MSIIKLKRKDFMNYIVRMRNLREDSDKTQKELAIVLKTSQTMYARYERGANELPIRHLITLAKFYDVSTDYLLGLTNEKKPFPKKQL